MPQRILVVDDDKQIARLIRSYLEQAGYQVVVAYDGETALHALRRESPDLVVLDLMLPDRDGWDVTRTVRSDPALAATPIIMVTARVEDTDKIIGLELAAMFPVHGPAPSRLNPFAGNQVGSVPDDTDGKLLPLHRDLQHSKTGLFAVEGHPLDRPLQPFILTRWFAFLHAGIANHINR